MIARSLRRGNLWVYEFINIVVALGRLLKIATIASDYRNHGMGFLRSLTVMERGCLWEGSACHFSEVGLEVGVC